MKDYKYLANKLDRQREVDMTSYEWEGSSTRKKLGVVCSFLIIAAVFLACLIGWVDEATGAPDIYSQDGQYLGNLSANRLDPDSVNNEYGRYGNPLSPESINNEYGRYGNRFSNDSPNNQYAIDTETPDNVVDSPYD